MAQDVLAKKLAFCVALGDFAERALALRDACEGFALFHTDNFTANPITQSDIDAGTTSRHLTPLIITDAVAAINALATLSLANRTKLRLAAANPTRRNQLPATG